MRILLLSQFYPPIVGGEERHVSNLAAALVSRRHSVSVATQWIPGAGPFEEDGAVRIHRIRGTMQRIRGVFHEHERRHAPPFPDPELTAGLWRVVALERPDIVHAHNWIYLSYLPLKKRVGVPLVVTLHDYSLVCAKKNHIHDGTICSGSHLLKCLQCACRHYGFLKGSVTAAALAPFSRLTLRNVNKFIAVSQAVAHYNRLAEFEVPYEVIPNFVPDDIGISTAPDRHGCLQQLPSEPFILFVGDVMPLKGVDILLEAYSRLPITAPPLVLLGRNFMDSAKLPPNVHHVGPWPHEAVMHAWDRCLFGVLPSIGLEAFGLVIIEAMSRGKPVIASKIGGIPDAVDHGGTGLLVPPGDAAELAGAMTELLTDTALRKRLGRIAARRVRGLKATPVVSRVEKLYRELAH